MIYYFLLFVILLLVGAVIFLAYKIYNLVRIVYVFENDISENISVLDEVDKSLDGIIQLKMFFDHKEIQPIVQEVIDRVKLAKLQVGDMSKRFTDRSKRKYYLIEDGEEDNIIEEPFNDLNSEPMIVPTNHKKPRPTQNDHVIPTIRRR